MCLARRAAGIDNVHTLRFAVRDGEIRMAYAPKKSPAFLLKAILVSFRGSFRAFLGTPALVFSITPPRPVNAESRLVIEQNRQVGLQVAAQDFMQLQHRLRSQLAPSTLIRFGRIGEAVAEHDAPLGEGRQNHFMNVLRAGSEHERHFRKRRKPRRGRMQQYLANFFPRRGAPRLPCNRDRKPVSAQRARQLFQLRALAAAVETLEGYESSANRPVGDDSRRVSQRL